MTSTSYAPVGPPHGPGTERPGHPREHHVFRSQRAGLPNVPRYVRDLWRRRQFVHEMARSTLRGQNYTNIFGQLWLVLNPLLLGCVYYVLADILSNGKHPSDYFAMLLGGLFIFYYFTGCMNGGAGSVIGASRLIMNSSFPRLLLPVTQIVIAFMRFLPSMLVFFVVHTVEGLPWGWNALWALPVLVCMTLFGSGLGFLFATVQVYFRDFRNFLPYLTRIWLFLSPVLWALETQVKNPGLKSTVIQLNPLSPIIGTWQDVLVRDQFTHPIWMVESAAWGVGAFVVGALVFMWREREFSVRL